MFSRVRDRQRGESTGSSIAACCRIGSRCSEIAAPLVGGRDADHINWLEQRYGWSQGAIPLRGWQLERKRRGLCGNDCLGG
jgi:hypothetical protein